MMLSGEQPDASAFATDVKGHRPWVGDLDRLDDHQTVFAIDAE